MGSTREYRPRLVDKKVAKARRQWTRKDDNRIVQAVHDSNGDYPIKLLAKEFDCTEYQVKVRIGFLRGAQSFKDIDYRRGGWFVKKGVHFQTYPC